ncbi:hypothetical protein ASD28_14485 [Massilia sp. Root133]|uniref:hypothetical protein n=2 Tax=unclassified Massilia TaxID=2609279 RepID=UPI0006FC3D6A|nr:hypothetical protein [Massilia sp. Root1485]KQX98313.1 hypothetical protein ASD28_14485 [Massilia sp. Root133]KQZ46998.1 hypothetical protein ASD92_24380 [Massilia sp. Root1485]
MAYSMRDLGGLGESVFSQWCASAGLTANGSNVDKTGWDFLVEFDYHSKPSLELSTVHEAAFECKVQVKATDKQARKLSIKLSNLKRLVTASMPAFIIFIEFDGKESPQRAFLVHVDEAMSLEILRRLHDAEHSGETHLLHKKTMTVKYGESHLLDSPSGVCLKGAMLAHMGPNMSAYVAKKNAHLNAAGFDEGFAQLTISAVGTEQISKLIDMSLGLAVNADISSMVAVKQRFGKKNRIPFVSEENVKLGMPDLKPKLEGFIKFKADKLGPSLTFPAKLYISPFNTMVPESMRRGRIAVEFLDLVFNPFANESTYTFSFDDKSLSLPILRDGLKLMKLLSIPGQTIFSELIVNHTPAMQFQIASPGTPFRLSSELEAVEAGANILSLLDISSSIMMSLAQASRNASRLIEMDNVLRAEANQFKLDIPLDNAPIPNGKRLACLSFFSTPIGDINVGVFVTMIGRPLPTDSGYTLLSEEKNIERVVIQERGEKIDSSELVSAAIAIEQKYAAEYEVRTLFDKADF